MSKRFCGKASFVLFCTVHLGEAEEVWLVEALEAHPGLVDWEHQAITPECGAAGAGNTVADSAS